MHFHAYNEKTVYIGPMPCRMTMLINGGGGLKVLLKPVSKVPSRFPSAFLTTACLGAFKLVGYLTLLSDGVLVLGGYQQVMDAVVSSEVNLYSYFIACLFETLTMTPGVGYY